MTALIMTTADLQRWRRLARQAQLMAAKPTLPVGDLVAAARQARKAVAPSHEALTNICSPLIRLAEAYGGMDDGARRQNVERLQWLAVALAPLVGAPPRPLSRSTLGVVERQNRLGLHIPAEPDDPRPDPAPRRDIFG